MSMRCFLALDKPLQKTEYPYKIVLPTISENDMFYNDKIFFSDKLTEAEQVVLGNIFRDFKVYAIHSGFQLNYDPELRRQISERYAENALEELKWLKHFAKKQLMRGDIFMIINLWLGKETDFNRIRSECLDINAWELSPEKSFEFSYGKIYQFLDNSSEAVLRRNKEKLRK